MDSRSVARCGSLHSMNTFPYRRWHSSLYHLSPSRQACCVFGLDSPTTKSMYASAPESVALPERSSLGMIMSVSRPRSAISAAVKNARNSPPASRRWNRCQVGVPTP